MTVALKNISGDDPLLLAAKNHLSLAIEYAGQYHNVRNGIYWMTAKSADKKGVRGKLGGLAFDASTALLDATRCLDQYGKLYPSTVLLLVWWSGVMVNLTLAQKALVREHQREIAGKQLALFDAF